MERGRRLRLLLDTHALVWWANGSARLSPTARAAIENADNLVWVSAVTVLEVSTKHRLGKLPEATLLARQFDQEVESEGFETLSITTRHGQFAGNLDIAHKDPFDRVLIAQSILENMVLVSNEAPFDGFGVSRLW